MPIELRGNRYFASLIVPEDVRGKLTYMRRKSTASS